MVIDRKELIRFLYDKRGVFDFSYDGKNYNDYQISGVNWESGTIDLVNRNRTRRLNGALMDKLIINATSRNIYIADFLCLKEFGMTYGKIREKCQDGMYRADVNCKLNTSRVSCPKSMSLVVGDKVVNFCKSYDTVIGVQVGDDYGFSEYYSSSSNKHWYEFCQYHNLSTQFCI